MKDDPLRYAAHLPPELLHASFSHVVATLNRQEGRRVHRHKGGGTDGLVLKFASSALLERAREVGEV